jgi:iron-sulfur cluster repair protein YtfE (RIC family)
MSVTKPLRDEHQELLPHVESLRLSAEAADGDPDRLVASLDEALAFLQKHLIPHARDEDAALYPVVEQAMQAPGATATMRRDRVDVVTLTQELQQLRLRRGFRPDPTEAIFTGLRPRRTASA